MEKSLRSKTSSMYERMREASVAEFRRRLYALLFCKHLLIFLVGWLFLWGAAVLVMRVANLLPWNLLFYGALGLLLAPLLAMVFTRRNLPSDETLCATLDRENLAGGLVVSSMEADISSWGSQVANLKIPNVKWESRKTYASAFLAVAFVLIAFTLPDRAIVADYRRPLNIEDQLERLNNQLETLKEENIIEVEKVEAIKSDLERIQKEAEGVGPVKTLEALDHLQNRLKQEAEKAAEEGIKESETLAKAEALADEAQKQSENFSPEDQSQLMQGLAEMLNEMLGETPDLFEKLAAMDEQSGENGGGENGGENGKEGGNENKQKQDGMGTQKVDAEKLRQMLKENNLDGLTPEQLQQLKEAMQQCREANKEMLERLKEGGMIDPEQLKQLRQVEKVDEEELKRMLEELGCCEGGECDCDGECDGSCQKPGRGGISRGRGDAPITFDDDEVSEEGMEFQSKILPPPALEELKNSLRFGSSRTAPSLTPGGSASDQGGALQELDQGIGSAHGHTILPQHRGPTGRYFDRN